MPDEQQSQQPQQPRRRTYARRDPQFITNPVRRNVKIYAVCEPELKSMASFNRLTCLFASIGAGFIGAVGASVIDVIKNPEEVKNWYFMLAIWGVLLISSLVSFYLAQHFAKDRDQLLSHISEETVEVDDQTITRAVSQAEGEQPSPT